LFETKTLNSPLLEKSLIGKGNDDVVHDVCERVCQKTKEQLTDQILNSGILHPEYCHEGELQHIDIVGVKTSKSIMLK